MRNPYAAGCDSTLFIPEAHHNVDRIRASGIDWRDLSIMYAIETNIGGGCAHAVFDVVYLDAAILVRGLTRETCMAMLAALVTTGYVDHAPGNWALFTLSSHGSDALSEADFNPQCPLGFEEHTP